MIWHGRSLIRLDIKQLLQFQLKPISDVADADKEMMQFMGFTGFDTTKNKHVEGNAMGESKINRARRYRQYMNRRGGFNRPLDYVA